MVNGSLWLPPGTPRELSLDEKAAGLEQLSRSVVTDAVPESPQRGIGTTLLFQMAHAADTFIPWGSSVQKRDQQLRGFWHTEPFLGGAIGSIAQRRAALDWSIRSESEAAALAATDMLQNANWGAGWEDFLIRFTLDLLTTDKGAFVELVREGDSPEAPVIMPVTLDSQRCWPTGIPETPVIYEDADSKYHLLKWYQVVQMLEMPAPVTFAGLGHFWRIQYSALTRILRAAQITKDVGVYNEEKISGRFQRGIHLFSGVTAQEVRDAMRTAEILANEAGLTRYIQPAMVGSMDPKADVKATTLDLAALPEGWDEEKALKWYITAMALAFGGEFQDFAPLPGGNLGSSAQSEVLDRKGRGKGESLWKQLVARLINLHGILPRGVEFAWDESDVQSDMETAEVRAARATARSTDVASGVLTPEIARRIMLDDGDLTQEQFDELERQAEELRRQREEAEAAALAAAQQGQQATVEGEDRGSGGPRGASQTVAEGEDRAVKALGGLTFGTLITSRLHRAYSVTADDASALGYFPELADRLSVADAIGPALRVFEDLLRESGVWDIPVAPEDADRIVEAGLKALSEERAGPDEARLALEDEVAGPIFRGLDEVRRNLRHRFEEAAGTKMVVPGATYDAAGRVAAIERPDGTVGIVQRDEKGYITGWEQRRGERALVSVVYRDADGRMTGWETKEGQPDDAGDDAAD